jgi:membrane protein
VKLPSIPGAVLDFGSQGFRRFVDVEGAQQATVLSAQAFTSLIPFLVVGSAFGPGDEDMADRINDRFGLHGSAANSVEALFADSGEVESAVTWVSIIILVLSATSFTRALQRMFERAYGTEPRGWDEAWRGLVWLGAFALFIVVSSPLRETLEDVGGIVFAIAVSTALGFVVWLGTPIILLGGMDWRRLLPGALVSAVLGALLSVASGIYMPILLTWSADKYGLIGIAFSIQSWLLATSFVVVVGAVIGALASDHFAPHLERLGRRRAGEPAG